MAGLALCLCAAACAPPPVSTQGRAVEAVETGARAAAPQRARPPAGGRQRLRPFALRSAELRRMDPELGRMAGPRFRQTSTQPLAITVRVAEPIDARPRASAPVIVLNGKRLESTRVRPDAPDELVAFLPDRSLLRADNEVSVVWLGNERQAPAPSPVLVSASSDL